MSKSAVHPCILTGSKSANCDLSAPLLVLLHSYILTPSLVPLSFLTYLFTALLGKDHQECKSATYLPVR
jgi:hypothetical protein